MEMIRNLHSEQLVVIPCGNCANAEYDRNYESTLHLRFLTFTEEPAKRVIVSHYINYKWCHVLRSIPNHSQPAGQTLLPLPQVIKQLRGYQGWLRMNDQLSDLVLWLTEHSLEKITCLVGC